MVGYQDALGRLQWEERVQWAVRGPGSTLQQPWACEATMEVARLVTTRAVAVQELLQHLLLTGEGHRQVKATMQLMLTMTMDLSRVMKKRGRQRLQMGESVLMEQKNRGVVWGVQEEAVVVGRTRCVDLLEASYWGTLGAFGRFCWCEEGDRVGPGSPLAVCLEQWPPLSGPLPAHPGNAHLTRMIWTLEWLCSSLPASVALQTAQEMCCRHLGPQ